ncbi:hypothetical protein L9G74_05730 [Shewanella sp. C32]|uniref:Uncharacterized protein n=1 Tax=Shewanella electrica TaxID=515560 RepID=A0ABT2FHX3_9GAMM|nr:hypothetical protein [Shewanella electrica]MCH1924030.1 hypothetical protein [Shewanella electrica]MCS4555933.1 hypothetical protein [Shewanella electrica]
MNRFFLWRWLSYLEAPLISLLLLGVVIPIALPIYLQSLDIHYWLKLAINALPLVGYVCFAIGYAPLKHNRMLAWFDDPLGRRPQEKKAGLGITMAMALGMVTQFISVVVLAFIA